MSFDRLIFIPFQRANAQDFVDEAQQIAALAVGNQIHHARRLAVVCYDDAGEPLKKLGFALNTRISIVGHGIAGRPYISNTKPTGDPTKEYVPFNVVCDRMILKGLQKRYCGAISCDVCYSGVKTDHNPSFADLVSRYLNHKGYLLLHTIGYNGSMNTVPETIAGTHKYLHRPVDVTGNASHKTSDWAAWKHYCGIWKVPTHLQGLASAANCPAW